jgi:hypothetical protein
LNKFILAAILILLPSFALAAEPRTDRPHWSLELKGGAFFPDTANWSKAYGSSYMGEYGGALSYKVLRQIEVGIEGSYARATGKGQLPIHGQLAGNSQVQAGKVTNEHVPLDLFVLAHGVFSENQWLVPYAGGGWTRMFYREEVQGQGKTQGSVNGYHARAGVQLLLDGLEPDASNNLYRDFGMHHTYLFLEAKYTHAMADTIPSGSINIGGTSCLGGFLFEF